MISFIKLTGENDRKYYISIKDITNINDINNAYDNLKSRVVTTGDIIYVKESCEEIMNKPNLLKSDIYNAISAMELKCMDEIHAYDIEKDRVGYYTKLGELNTYTKLKHFIADYPIMIEHGGEENGN